MKKVLLFVSILCMFSIFAVAQNVAKNKSKLSTVSTPLNSTLFGQSSTVPTGNSTNFIRCGSYDALQLEMANDSIFRQQRKVLETYVDNWIKDHPNYDSKTTVTIPVVVHIIYNTTAQNIADSRVTAQIAATNADFGGTNTHSMEAFSTNLKSNTQVQFCLAQRDPSGNATTGITRTQTSVTSFSPTGSSASCSGYPERCASSGGCAAWDVTKYLNVWVCNLGNSLCGISEFPTSPLNNYYGSTIHYQFFGTTGSSAPYNLGGTLTHEIGHCFNLYHIWGDDGGTCSGSDYCTDTPNQGNDNINTGNWSGVHTDNCATSSPGMMYMNFMDYSDDIDYANFTPNQTTRIAAVLASSGPGYSLTTSNGCTPVTAGAPVANFSASATNITVGTTVNFTDLSSGSPTQWLWTLAPTTGFAWAGGTTSASQNPHITFNTVGTYSVTLKATNTYGNNSMTKTSYIVVSTGGTSTCDTLHYPLTGTAVIYQDGNGGYLAGNNSYNDKVKADYFATYAPYTKITGAYFYFGVAKHTGSTSNITFKVYNNGGTGGAPGTAIATATLPLSTIVTATSSQQPVYVSFTPFNIPGPFYVGVVLPTVAGDTLALVTNSDGDTSPGTGWEQFSDNTWHAYSESGTSWGVNIQNAIWPVVCTGTVFGIDENSVDNIQIYPNPANDVLNIDLANYLSENVKVKLYNTVGQLITSIDNNSASPLIKVDLKNAKTGIYFISVQTEKGTLIRKISVIK